MVDRRDPSLASRLATLGDQISTVVVGKRAQIDDCIACLLAGGHLLIEDVPGVGKTTLAHTLAVSLGLDFRRVQFTADLLPSDLIGSLTGLTRCARPPHPLKSHGAAVVGGAIEG